MSDKETDSEDPRRTAASDADRQVAAAERESRRLHATSCNVQVLYSSLFKVWRNLIHNNIRLIENWQNAIS